MNYSRSNDNRIRANELVLRQIKDWSIDINVEPVLDYNIPLTVVFAKFSAIPPRSIKLSVTESKNFGERIVPAVKETEKN
jgi:hypothetical protein